MSPSRDTWCCRITQEASAQDRASTIKCFGPSRRHHQVAHVFRSKKPLESHPCGDHLLAYTALFPWSLLRAVCHFPGCHDHLAIWRVSPAGSRHSCEYRRKERFAAKPKAITASRHQRCFATYRQRQEDSDLTPTNILLDRPCDDEMVQTSSGEVMRCEQTCRGLWIFACRFPRRQS